VCWLKERSLPGRAGALAALRGFVLPFRTAASYMRLTLGMILHKLLDPGALLCFSMISCQMFLYCIFEYKMVYLDLTQREQGRISEKVFMII